MRNIHTRTKCLKKKIIKCKDIFRAYSDIQFNYVDKLEKDESIIEIKCNVCGIYFAFYACQCQSKHI